MRSTVLIRSWSVSWWRNERGIVLALALVVMTLLMGVGSAALFSGYTNLQTSTNLRLGTRARATAEAAVNEALYRLSRQEGKPGAIAPDLTTANWQMQILSHGTANSPTQVATIQATGDWPHAASTPPVVVRYKKDASGSVIFYDRTRNPSLFPIALPAASIPDTAHPVLQILATGFDDREAQRQILAEAVGTTAFAPPAPLSSGVNVDLNGSGFLDGVNHSHLIYITPGNGNATIYGDNATGGTHEVTDFHSGTVSKDSPDDNKNDNVSPRACGNSGDHNVANSTLLPVTAPATPYSSCARLFNMQISATDKTAAWVGLQWIADPTHVPVGNTTYNCTIAPYNHSAAAHWHGTNTGYASAVALSSGPTVIRDQPPTSSVWTRGVFTWGKNNATNIGTIPTYPSSCSSGATLVCRPAQLT